MKKKIKKIQMQLAWFNDFVDYIQTSNHKLYNDACCYADEKEDDISEN